MKSVRAMLVALVLACVTPAVASAVLQAREAESTLLEDATRRVDHVNTLVASELADYESNARMALILVDQATTFRAAMAARDAARAQVLVNLLAKVYPRRIVFAANADGSRLAVGNADRAPKSLQADASPAFADLLAGRRLEGLIPVTFADGRGYGLVAAEPVSVDGELVGAVALLTPVDDAYLERLGKKVDANLALRIDTAVVATSLGHLDPGPGSRAGAAALASEGEKLYATKTFAPDGLQYAGHRVELTASREVTELRRRSRAMLLRSVGVLGPVLLLGLVIAFVIARRIGSSVRGISDAAASVKEGHYVTVTESAEADELGQLGRDFNAMVRGLVERDRLRATFGRYVTRQVADHVLSGNGQLGGELVPVTVLFSDIRSFTTLSEHMPPRELLDFLNVFFSGMVESVMAHDGVVDKFIGDAIMAVFGAPEPKAGDALNAIKAALSMRQRLADINEGFRAAGKPEIRAGIGLHAGEVVAGNMGHVERMEYTVIGDAVNLASRIEGMTKELHTDILISEDLYRKVEGQVDAEPLQRIHVKGREQKVMVYRLKNLRPPHGHVDRAPEVQSPRVG
jgi:adenylate cyclase